MKTNLINFRLGQEITEKSDRFIVWNTKHYSNYRLIENRFHQCDFTQFEEKEYDSQTKRLWIYVNHPEKKLMYVCEVIPVRGKVEINPDCKICQEFNANEETEKYNEGKLQSYVSDKICRFAYELKLIHKFDKGNNLEELRNYTHEKTGKPWKPPQSFVYVNSYPRLVEDIKLGKIW